MSYQGMFQPEELWVMGTVRSECALFHLPAPAREGIPLPTLMPLQPFQQGIWVRRPFTSYPHSYPTTAGSSFVSQEDWVGERGSLQQEKGLPVHGFTLGKLSPR